ncbi:unnamed protein product [Linum tenue]|uniref:Peptidase A1 domain-containing protein n=2 Tax=Linum tenue TaxID=586396 RepID=A0AAV0LEU5_9ROSI|nr:unnamed protein product [Linum tenue]
MATHVPTFALATSLAVFLCIICTTSTSVHAANSRHGFSVRLTHRDSTNSPFYDPKETSAQRMGNAARRSISRANRFSSSSSSLSNTTAGAELITGDGEYLMNISIGTPPFPVVAIADTGSDIIWTQCKPCADCYKQDAPLFDPNSSATYRTAPCQSKPCVSLAHDGSFCSPKGDVCQYQVRYGDGSHTSGDVAVDTLTLGLTNAAAGYVAFPNIVIGCGHDSSGTFSPKASGIIGLGGGPGSLITQMGPSIGGKFSYCMVPYFEAPEHTSSTMNFGQNAVVSGNGVVTSPFSSSAVVPTFYMLQLDSVSVGSTNIPFKSASLGGSGNIVIDSGTTLTLVPTDFLAQMSAAFESQVNGTKATDPQGLLSPCYVADSTLKYVPPVTAHFKGGDVALRPYNVLVPMSDTVVCLAFYGLDEISIYGNIAQQNFLVGYDLLKQTVSFKPTDCTKN